MSMASSSFDLESEASDGVSNDGSSQCRKKQRPWYLQIPRPYNDGVETSTCSSAIRPIFETYINSVSNYLFWFECEGIPMCTCYECKNNCKETDGRWVILGENNDGFDWMFLCISCIRDWRQRGLQGENLSPDAIKTILNKEYPNH